MKWIFLAAVIGTTPVVESNTSLLSSVQPTATPIPIPVRLPKKRATYTFAAAPKTPDGLAACTDALVFQGDLPRYLGETIRYTVEVDGLSVGRIDFKTERDGSFQGQAVTEYRSHFQIDSLVATMVPVEGRAAAIVPLGESTAQHAMNRYSLKDKQYEEELSWESEPATVVSNRSRNGKARRVKRLFTSETRDFITAFYLLRAMPAKFSGCTLLFANQRAYTVQLNYAGDERVKTPVGLRDAERYNVRYAHERAKKTISATIWVSKEGDRLPYQAEIHGRNHLLARVHLFIPGVSPR